MMRRILYCLVIISAAQAGSGAIMPSSSHTQECPTIMVDCPAEASEPGKPETFTAQVEGADPKLVLTYKWTVSAGSIISGQGTSAITVDTVGAWGQSITATMEVDGLDPRCGKSASCTRSAPALAPLSRKFDEYGNTAFKDEKARLSKFAKQLQNEPESRGYIITYGRRHGRVGEAQAHANHAKSYLVKTYSIAPERMVTVDGGFRTNFEVELWLVPTGAKPPTPTPTVSPDKVRTNKDDVKRN